MSTCGFAEPFGIVTLNDLVPLVLAFGGAICCAVISVIVVIIFIKKPRVSRDSDHYNGQ